MTDQPKRGRPSSLTPELRRLIGEGVRRGYSVSAIARAVGRRREMLHRWRRQDPELRALVHGAQLLGLLDRLRALAAEDGHPGAFGPDDAEVVVELARIALEAGDPAIRGEAAELLVRRIYSSDPSIPRAQTAVLDDLFARAWDAGLDAAAADRGADEAAK